MSRTEPPNAVAPSPRVAYLLLALAALFWGGNWVVGRALADRVPPVALTFWRWTIALALIAPWVGPRLWRQRALLRRHWRAVTALGLLGGGLHNLLQYWALRYTSATNGAILNSLTPVLIILLGALVLRDPLPRRAALGACVSLGGALCLVTRLDWGIVSGLRFNAGDLLVVASLLMLAAYTLALRWRPPGLDPLAFLASFVAVGLAPIALAYALELAAGQRMRLDAPAVAGLAYVAVFPALLAYHFFNLGVAAVGPARAGVFIHLTPLFGSLLGVGLLGERFGPHHVLGVVLILGGIAVATRTGAR